MGGFGMLPSGPQMGTVDRMPQINAAGLPLGDPEDSMVAVMAATRPPPTPDELQRWRRDYTPGKSLPPPGSHYDTAHMRIETYGKVEARVPGDTVADNVNVAPKSSLMERQLEKREALYRSNKMEPLGRAFTRGHVIPDGIRETGFGCPTPQVLV